MKTHSLIDQIPAAQWDALARPAGDHPLTRHCFLSAFEKTGCVGEKTAWQPEHLTWWDSDTLIAALPLYRKTDSYGEFVFDWAWARAFHEAGGQYYPKLLSALPFTPCPGPRLLARDDATRERAMRETLAYAAGENVSSFHVLFCDAQEANDWRACGADVRNGVQFHWQRAGATTFDEYLATMTHDKRKRIKQERRKVHDAGVNFRVMRGNEISESDWNHFYRCYQTTYAVRGSAPYLTSAFFRSFAFAQPDAQLMVIGERSGVPICAALNWLGETSLYGRYWGTLEYVSGLHFETCYYQALAWCIEHGINRFEGGAQGEHKLARGFLPVETASAHWIAHDGLRNAVQRFLARERDSVSHALDELDASSPFKVTP